MTSANHPPQPPTKRQDAPEVAKDLIGVSDRVNTQNAIQNANATPHAKKSGEATGDKSIQPLWGSLYAVGAARGPRIAKHEFRISINQFDKHRNRFFDVIERVRFLDGAGVLTDRIILDVRGLIVQIVAYADDPVTVLVKIGEDVWMIRRAALILIFLHLAKRSQA